MRLFIALIFSLQKPARYAIKNLVLLLTPAKPVMIFNDKYIHTKNWYVHLFKRIPDMSYLGSIGGDKVIDLIKEGLAGEVRSIHQNSYYNWVEDGTTIEHCVFRMEEEMLIEVGRGHVQIYFKSDRQEFVEKLANKFLELRLPEKEQDFEINIITLTQQGLDLKMLPLTPSSLDIALFYNDDFAEVDALIRSRLMMKDDKGIVLLHGLPGTGKTSYLRYLIGSLNKKVLFVSPAVAGNLMNPEFIDLLIDNPNSILIIEDAENLILDRRYNSNSSVSNLLNISDGLLSDCLNVQIICTFNSELNTLDSALLRKGRLIARYEFDKLTTGKAIRLSAHLGFDTAITRPMTLAEITNPGEAQSSQEKKHLIGFRRVEEVMEN